MSKFWTYFYQKTCRKVGWTPVDKTKLGLEQCSVTLEGFGGLKFGFKNLRAKHKFYAIVDHLFKMRYL